MIQNISRPTKSEKPIKSVHLPLESGPNKEELNASDQEIQNVQNDFIVQKTSKRYLEKNLPQEEQSCTQELVPTNKKKTSKGRKKPSKKNIPKENPCQISDQDSTGREKTLIPFWNQFSKEVSTKLWLPTETDCVDLDSNSLNPFVSSMVQKSWFSIKILTKKKTPQSSKKTFWQSLPFLQQDIMVKDPTETKDSQDLITKEYYLRYNKEQKLKFTKWLGVYRFIYNKCLAHVKQKKKFNKAELRKLFIHNKPYEIENEWMLRESVYDFRDGALLNLEDNISSLSERLKVDDRYKNYKKKDLVLLAIEKLKYKSKKIEYKNNASVTILSKFWNPKTPRSFYYDLCSKKSIKCSHCLPNKVHHTLKLVRTKYGRYKLCEPIDLPVDNQDRKRKIVSIDPGSKIFLTCYDPDGNVIFIGKDDMQVIGRLLHYRKKLQSKKDLQKKRNKKYKMRRAIKRINEKLNNLIEDLHKKVSKFLCVNYTDIFIPKLNFHTMKKLGKVYKLKLASLRLCSFVDFLKHQATKYKCNVKVVTEEYTSKTCGKCGNIGSCDNKRMYNCKACKMSLNRDINGARNILIKELSNKDN